MFDTKITIIGRGLDPSKHLSLSALTALKRADKILGIESENEFWYNLRKEFNLVEIEDISSLYLNNENDLTNYKNFIKLINDSTSKHRDIVLLVAGHPRIGVSFIGLLQKELASNIQLEVIEGISSFDVMLNQLSIDPLEQGTCILDANRLLLFQYKIETALCYFIYHICSVGNPKTNYLNPAQDNQLTYLKKHLLKYYQKTKILYLCRASNGKHQDSKITPLPIIELDKDLSLIDYSTTLYIPPEDPKQLDFKFLNLLRVT